MALCALSLQLFAGCVSPEEHLTEATSQPLTSGVKQAANGAACTAGGDDTAAENDCLTIENSWGQAGARPANHNNDDGKLVYTGIDATDDDDLIAIEKTFAEGFHTAGGKAQGAVYGAHGDPGWIQGMPDRAADGGAGTILHESFGAGNIPWLSLSVCFGGNTGADTSADALADTPPTYVNNISAASFITTYHAIASGAIVACKNGVVGPDDAVLWCKQQKQKRAGWNKPKLLGNAMLVQGNGAMRGAAVTKNTANDATGDYVLELQAEGPDDDMDGDPDYPARHFKARNLPKKRVKRNRMTGQFPYPWNLDNRCNTCADGICTVQDNYPSFQAMPMCIAQPQPEPGPGPYPSPSPTTATATATATATGSSPGCSLMDITLTGRFLTSDVVVEQPDGSIVPVTGVIASPDGMYAHFQFAPTQVGTHYIHVTDEDGLVNDPQDEDFVMYESFQVFSAPIGTVITTAPVITTAL